MFKKIWNKGMEMDALEIGDAFLFNFYDRLIIWTIISLPFKKGRGWAIKYNHWSYDYVDGLIAEEENTISRTKLEGKNAWIAIESVPISDENKQKLFVRILFTGNKYGKL